MPVVSHYTAFAGKRLLASGAAWEVGVAVRRAQDENAAVATLIFDNRMGRQIDFDLRGTDEEVAARLKTSDEQQPQETSKGRGRPRLGVIAREVTLLPRHWDWLKGQPGGASATLRKLVDAARKQDGGRQTVRDSQQAADRFMMTMLGDQPGYEEAARALYAGDRTMFLSLSEPWPADVRNHARQLAKPAFDD